MARREDQPQHVVADVVVHRGMKRGLRVGAFLLEIARERLVLVGHARTTAQQVDGPTFASGHQPCAWVAGNALGRPLLQGGDERVVRQVLGDRQVAREPREPGDQPRGLQSPDGLDRAPRVGGSHHWVRSTSA